MNHIMKKRLLSTAWLMILSAVYVITAMAQTVTVQVTSSGGLWDALEAQGITDFTTVKNLTVTGTMGDADFLLIKNQMTSLVDIDLSDTNVKDLPDNLFYDRTLITDITGDAAEVQKAIEYLRKTGIIVEEEK